MAIWLKAKAREAEGEEPELTFTPPKLTIERSKLTFG
jgi:hypothetical protein